MARSLSPIGVQQDLSGRIFDIQSYSVHDGPGCRTLVFLSGCPLRCEWCANPEGLENRVRTLFRVMKCINRTQGCTRCIPKCPHQAISISDEKEIPLAIDWEKCRHCESHECVDACLQEAFVPASRDMKVSELMKIFDRDRHYWSGKGGATFSGGDPLLLRNREELTEFLKEIKKNYPEKTIWLYTGYLWDDVQDLELIQAAAFAGETSLTEVTMYDSLTEIQMAAFAGTDRKSTRLNSSHT